MTALTTDLEALLSGLNAGSLGPTNREVARGLASFR